MRELLQVMCLLLIPGFVWGQTTAQHADSPANSADVAAELRTLREELLRTKQQVATQQQEIDSLKGQSRNGASVNATNKDADADNLAASALEPATGYAGANVQPSGQPVQEAKREQEPLGSFRVGDAILQLGGFVDFENIFRTTNTQDNIATAFGTIPFNNIAQGRVTELRTTGQFSRLNLKVSDHFRGTDFVGYIEGDFSGNSAPNVYQSVNGLTNRLRLYFVDARHSRWELLAGQTWSWLTPNREGIGPMPADLALTYNEDQNLSVGITYTRAPEFRVAYHPDVHWAMGVGIEASNQYIGNYVALPEAFTSISSQFDNNNQIGAPNFFPDILAKITHDRTIADRHFHAEIVGLITGAHASVKPVGEPSFQSRSVIGGGAQIAANYELVRDKLILLANAFWSDGGAHYLVATGPQLVVRPNAAGTDVRLSMVHAGAGSAGLEWRATPKQAFAVYYAADYFGRNFFPDTTNTANPGAMIGFGGPGSSNINNRAIQQITFDWLQTFWKDRRYGALQTYVQYSYLTRSPWYVAPGDPKNAHLSMVYAGFRYVLPSTAGTLLRVPYPN